MEPLKIYSKQARMDKAQKDLLIRPFDMSDMHYLSRMFSLQRELRNFYMETTSLGSMTQHQRTGYYGLAMITEIGELLENVRGWKPHQSNPPPVDTGNVREELADIMHFMINLCLEWGITSTELYMIYFNKNMENRRRQHEGY